MTVDHKDTVRVKVDRPAYTLEDFNKTYARQKTTSSDIRSKIKRTLSRARTVSPASLKNFICQIIPILVWLPQYKWRYYLLGDILSGVTISVLHIPLGMGYANLANIPPINGIYMAFFPVLVYAIFGSSRHLHLGSFAVVMIMLGGVVETHRTDISGADESTLSMNVSTVNSTVITPVDIATSMCIMSGIFQILLSLLSAGYLSVFLSDVLVSGFTTGAAIHVVTSQMKHLFGLKLPSFVGVGQVILTWISIFEALPNTNVVALIVCISSLIFLIINNEILKDWLKKVIPVPFPMELLVVVVSTSVCYLARLHEKYDLPIVGEVATGFPKPTVPRFIAQTGIIVQAFVTAIVAFVVSFAMARIYAKRDDYSVDPNQELFAHGVSNIIGSFFLCAVMCDAPGRSLTGYSAGGKTQLAALVSCFILVFVLLYIGPLLRTLPKAALSSIICSALKGLLFQVSELVYFWNRSKVDGVLWLVTFLSVVLADIDYGLVVGFGLSILILLWQTLRPYSSLVVPMSGTEIFMDVKFYREALPNDMVKCFRFHGPLHFANREYFRDHLYGRTRFDPARWKLTQTKLKHKADKDLRLHNMSAASVPGGNFSSSEVPREEGPEIPRTPVTPRSGSFIKDLANSIKSSMRKKRPRPDEVFVTPSSYNLLDLAGKAELDDTTSPERESVTSFRAVAPSLGNLHLLSSRPSDTGPLHLVDNDLGDVDISPHCDERGMSLSGLGEPPHSSRLPFQFLLIDFSGVSSIDPSGAEMVVTIVKQYVSCGIVVYLCGIAGHLLRVLSRLGLSSSVGEGCHFFPCLIDAYKHAHAVKSSEKTDYKDNGFIVF